METKRTRIGLAVVLVLGLGAGLVALWPQPETPELRVDILQAPTAGKSVKAVTAAPAPARRPSPVYADQYQLDYELTFDVPDAITGAGGLGRSTGKLTLRGTLERPPVVEEDGGRWQAGRLVGVTLQQDEGARQLGGLAGTAQGTDFASTWLERLETDGRVAEVRFDKGMPVSARGLVASLVAVTQFAQPDSPRTLDWLAIEKDVNGSWTAAYVREAAGTVLKTVQERPSDDAPGRQLASTARYTFQDGRLQSVTVDQRGELGIPVPGTDLRARFETRVSLRRSGSVPASQALRVAAARLVPFDAMADAHAALEHRATASFSDLLAAAEDAGDRKARDDRSRVANELAAKLRQEPELVATVVGHLRQGVAKDPVERTLVEGLVRAGSGPAQKALAGLAADSTVRADLRERVLAGSVFVSKPDEAFLASLHRLAFEESTYLASMAAMTLGAALSRRLDVDPQGSQKAVQAMASHTQDLLGPARSGEKRPTLADQCNWLAALGNTGAPEALPALLAGLKHSEELVRVSAALALRFQDSAAVLPAMHEALRTDDSIHVRDNLVQAARFMGPDALPFVQKALFTDDSEFVRLGAAHTIAAWAMEAPALDEVLAQAVKLEKSEKVRESLRNYLEPGREAGPWKRVGKARKGT